MGNVVYDKRQYEIAAQFSGLQDGETASGEVCPACEGGATKEKSLSVTRRSGTLLWNCHRASCSFRGSDGRASFDEGDGQKRSRGSRSYVPAYVPDQATLGLLAAKFGIPRESFELAGLRWTGEGNGPYGRRFCYPIYGPSSRKRGENYRSYEKGVQPKSIIQLGEDEVAMCWYKWKRQSDVLIIVEDQVSAIKIASSYHAVALLGTNLSEAKVQELIDNNEYKHIYICLDNDATHQAIKLQLKWRERIKNLRVMGLDKDVKDMDAVEFDSFQLRFI